MRSSVAVAKLNFPKLAETNAALRNHSQRCTPGALLASSKSVTLLPRPSTS